MNVLVCLGRRSKWNVWMLNKRWEKATDAPVSGGFFFQAFLHDRRHVDASRSGIPPSHPSKSDTMGRNQTSMKRGKLQSVVKQMRQVQTAAQKRRRLDKEREAAARNKEARNHKIAAERAKLPFASYAPIGRRPHLGHAFSCLLVSYLTRSN